MKKPATLFAGLDIHKDSLSVAYVPDNRRAEVTYFGCMRLLGGTTIVLLQVADYIPGLQVRRLHHDRDHAGIAALRMDLSKLEEYTLTCVKVNACAVATYGPARSLND
jgi:hypothetical protein